MNATNGLVYDAVGLLRFGPALHETLPEAQPGEIVIRYGGWSLQELRNNDLDCRRDLVQDQLWYNRYPWSIERLPVGVYRLCIPVPNSNRQPFAEQVRLLPASDQPAPVVLVATALLVHRLQTGEDLLKNDCTRCREQTAGGLRVELRWVDGRLRVNGGWAAVRGDYVGLSSVRTF